MSSLYLFVLIYLYSLYIFLMAFLIKWNLKRREEEASDNKSIGFSCLGAALAADVASVLYVTICCHFRLARKGSKHL